MSRQSGSAAFMPPWFKLSVVAGLLVALATAPSPAQLSFQTVAFSGDAAPGTDDEEFVTLSAPSINNAGQVAFEATAESTAPIGSRTSRGVFGPTPTGLGLIASEFGGLSPGGGATNVDFAFLRDVNIVLNDAGQVAFDATLRNPEGPDVLQAVIGPTGNGPGLIAVEGGAAPGVDDGAEFDGFDERTISLSNSGAVAFEAFLRTGSGPEVPPSRSGALFGPTAGGLGLVSREGDLLPGAAADGPLVVSFGAPRVNASGAIAAPTAIFQDTGSTPTAPPDANISNGTATLLAPAGGAAQRAFESVQFSEPGINNAGQVVLVEGGEVLIITDAGAEVVAAFGDPAPGQPGQVLGRPSGFESETFFNPLVNGQGGVFVAAAFDDATPAPTTGPVTPFNDPFGRGLLRIVDEEATLLFVDGQPLPGADDGATISLTDFFATGDDRSGFSVNEAGDVVFASRNSALLPGGAFRDDSAIVAYSQALEELLVVARVGELFDVSDDPLAPELREIAGVGLVTGSGGEDGLARSLNDSGQIAFQLTFADGSSGVFLTALPVPEPHGFLLLAIGASVAACPGAWRFRD